MRFEVMAIGSDRIDCVLCAIDVLIGDELLRDWEAFGASDDALVAYYQRSAHFL